MYSTYAGVHFRRPRRVGHLYRGRYHHLRAFGHYAPLRNGGFGGPVPHQPELKAIDVQRLNTQLSDNATGNTNGVSTWDSYVLNAVDQGTSLYSRIGQKITMMSALLRIQVQMSNINGTAGFTSAGFVRFLLVYDAQPNSSALSIATVLGLLSTSGPIDYTTPTNLDSRERVRILMDKTRTLDNVVWIDTSKPPIYSGPKASPGLEC